MGIEKFFSTINKNFQIVSTINLDNSESDLIKSKYLFLDFNSIIHNVSGKLINELNSKETKTNIKLDDLEYMIIKEVNLFIIKILKRLDLEKIECVYAALDGVPSFAKILEQKKRRFIGDFIEKLLYKYSLPFNWSKNNISPSTLFMDKINKYLNNIKLITKNKLVKKEDLILKQKDYEFYSKLKKFDYSDTNIKGEGEMKIFDDINSLKLKENESVIFYSPDADVILLSMISKNANNIIIFKYDQNSETLYSIKIEELKQTIYSYCLDRIEGSNTDVNMKKLIKDIVFIFTIFGNDFLPKFESIQTNFDFLFLLDMYLINLIDNGYILTDDKIIFKSFLGYLKLMSNHEKRMIFRNAYLNAYFNYNYASQKNFIIDLLKLKKLDNKLVSKYLYSKKFSEPFYNFFNNLLFFIDPFKIKEYINKNSKNKYPKNKYPKNKYHGCLEFYLLDNNKMIEVLKNSLENILPINSNVTINISDLNENSSYETLKETQFSSKQKKHIMNMKDLSPRDSELYLINNKLDKYYSLFNPINEFLSNILKTRKVNENFYYQKYFDNHDKKIVVSAYMKGLNWIHQYYYNRSKGIDETWYYPYYKAPLFETIVNNYSSTTFEHNIKNKKLKIDPLAQLLYITPVRLSDLSKPDFYKLFTKNENLIKKVKEFIERYPQFFYNLDEIYKSVNSGNLNKNLFDCSHSTFISKCHYQILNYIVDINQFVLKLKQINYS
jgi:hypothetical protein